MNYINPPVNPPANIHHRTFHSKLYGHELGYNIYLPPDYAESGRRYPVVYHLHGWTGHESSEIAAMAPVCRSRDAITVFPNNSSPLEGSGDLPVESMIFEELIPHIERTYRTETGRGSRSVSGFSMGGGMAMFFAVRHLDVVSSVTAYAGTYHHYYHSDYSTVGVSAALAPEIHSAMIREQKYFDRSIIRLLNQNADAVRRNLRISLHIGTEDVLYCDNEILRLHLESLQIPHEYRRFPGAAHALSDIL